MNQIKQKIEEIGLSQREISVRLGKNPSYLAGVFRSGLSTAKQAELLERLEVVAGGGTVQSDNQIIAELSQKLADCHDSNIDLKKESDIYFAECKRLSKELGRSQEWVEWKQKQLTETQKYLLESNQEVEQIESKYRAVLIFNYVLSLVILGITIAWVLK